MSFLADIERRLGQKKLEYEKNMAKVGSKIIAIDVPNSLHARMKAFLGSKKARELKLKSKRDLLFWTLEKGMDILEGKQAPAEALGRDYITRATKDLQKVLESNNLPKGYRVEAGKTDILVYHPPDAMIGPGLVPDNFDGFPVRLVPITSSSVVNVSP